MKNISIILILVYNLSLFGCSYFEINKRKKNIKKNVTSWYHKTITMPDTITLFFNNDIKKVQTKNYLNKEIKLLSILSNNCSNCTFSQLSFWDDFYSTYSENENFQLVLIYNGLNDYFCNVLYHEADVKLPIFLDEQDILIKNNSIFKEKLYRTVLLNSENKIILMGDLTGNIQLEQLYKEEIDKQLN